MKIGVLTYFCVPNYGAMLQAYALWHYLEQRGHEVEFIDYAFASAMRLPLWRCLVSRSIKGLKNKLKSYVRFPMTIFSAGYPRTRRFYSYTDLKANCPFYDVVIVGSDQMWNPMWCQGELLPVVMLDFVTYGVRRLAYAVSFGTTAWRKDQGASEAGRMLKQIESVSVREKSGLEVVRMLAGRNDARWLIDPTLLFGEKFYRDVFEGNKPQAEDDGEYIFKYILDEWGDSKAVASVQKQISSKTGIFKIKTDRSPVNGPLGLFCSSLGVMSKVSVEKWLRLISHAKFVITNSFHGTVFAILFRRPFVSLLLEGRMAGMNERIVSLLTILGVGNRAVSPTHVEDVGSLISKSIDWDDVFVRLEKERQRVKDFFEEARL